MSITLTKSTYSLNIQHIPRAVCQTSFATMLCIAIYLFAWKIQDNTLLNRDVSWLLQVTKQLLDGGIYVRDFFEIDPPGILYVYSPVIFLIKYCALPTDIAFKLYIFCLTSLSLSLSYPLLKKIIADPFLRHAIFLTMTAVFLIFPVEELGQKEHLLVLFSMPYLLYISLLAQKPAEHISNIKTGLIGCIAGVGFCLKPYFLIVPILLELHHAWAQKNPFACLRTDTGLICLVLITYCLALLSFHQTYLLIELPLLLRYFYSSISSTMSMLLFNPITCFFYFSIALFAIQKKNMPYQSLCTTLVLALSGLTIAYIAQRTLWYYHLLPILSLTTVLVVILTNPVPTPKSLTLNSTPQPTSFKIAWQQLVYGLAYIGLLINIYVYINAPTLFIILVPVLSYALFNWLISSCFTKALPYTLLGSLVLCLLFDFFMYWQYNDAGTPEQRSTLYFVLIHMLMLLVCFTHQLYQQKIDSLRTIYLFSILSTPFFLVFERIEAASIFNQLHQPFIQLLNQHANQKSVYFFSTGVEMFPFVYLSQAKYMSRFEHMVILPKLISEHTQEAQKDNTFFRQLVAQDLRLHHPHLIFINTTDVGLGKEQFQLSSYIPYITYFSKNKLFQNEWKHYHYLTNISIETLARHFDIYQRDET